MTHTRRLEVDLRKDGGAGNLSGTSLKLTMLMLWVMLNPQRPITGPWGKVPCRYLSKWGTQHRR